MHFISSCRKDCYDFAGSLVGSVHEGLIQEYSVACGVDLLPQVELSVLLQQTRTPTLITIIPLFYCRLLTLFYCRLLPLLYCPLLSLFYCRLLPLFYCRLFITHHPIQYVCIYQLMQNNHWILYLYQFCNQALINCWIGEGQCAILVILATNLKLLKLV